LISAPWDDCEQLFRAGEDFLMVKDGAAMSRALTQLMNDGAMRRALARSGLETILSRHSCAHRADELLAIAAQIGAVQLESAA
jgi:spore maturation protein CgeB